MSSMDTVLKNCCGLDVHKDIIQACIQKGTGNDPEVIERQFTAMREDLYALRDWLRENECRHIAMESTGVYWMPIYEILEDDEDVEELFVVNAYHMRNVPGRKSDQKDAEWIAHLFRHGMLSNSYVPSKDMRNLREVARMKRKLTSNQVSCHNRLEKFLQARGFKLSSVVSDITGVSARNMLNILVKKGKLTLREIHDARRKNLKATSGELLCALSGELDQTERMILSNYLSQWDELDRQISMLIDLMSEIAQDYTTKVQLLDSIPGIGVDAAMSLLAEIGPDPYKHFKNSGQLCKWAGLTPRNDESAGKIKSRKTLHGNHYIKSLLCQCAWAAVKVRGCKFHGWFWRNKARLGDKKAIIAVARKMLALVFTLLASGEFYDPIKASSPYIIATAK